MSKPTIVKFTKSWNGYGPGEVAGFPAEKAEQLVEAGLAEVNGKASPAKSQKAAAKQDQSSSAADDAASADTDEKP